MSSRRQQRCGCSQHGAQLSASTCRRRSWLYGVALSDGTHAVPPLCFLLYVLYFLIMREGVLWHEHTELCILKRIYERNSLLSELSIFSSRFRGTSDLCLVLTGPAHWRMSEISPISLQHFKQEDSAQQVRLIWIRGAVVDFQVSSCVAFTSTKSNRDDERWANTDVNLINYVMNFGSYDAVRLHALQLPDYSRLSAVNWFL